MRVERTVYCQVCGADYKQTDYCAEDMHNVPHLYCCGVCGSRNIIVEAVSLRERNEPSGSVVPTEKSLRRELYRQEES